MTQASDVTGDRETRPAGRSPGGTRDQAGADPLAGHLRRGLARITALDGVDVSLGGAVSAGGTRLVLSELRNFRTSLLRGVLVRPGIGLGGRVLEQRKPVCVADYVASGGITHDFDRAVRAEVLHGAIALPVAVDGVTRAVLYGGTRQAGLFGERVLDAAMGIAGQVSRDITVAEEVERRVRALAGQQGAAPEPVLSRGELAEVHDELVSIAATVADERTRSRLIELSSKLVRSAGRSAPGGSAPGVSLSRREGEVLGLIAAGHTNPEVAELLAVLPTTVKTHLKNAMHKLAARNRMEAVSAARAAGLLP